ncbi:MAG: Rossmann-like domain-containing protein [Candidatus Hadarchaeaceae archaeon]
MIVDDLLSLIEKRKNNLENLTLSKVCISLCYTAVMLNNEYVGLCHTPTEDIAHTHAGRRSDFHGFKALDVARLSNSFDVIDRVVGIATLNAISQYIMDSEGYSRGFGVDAMDEIDVKAEDEAAVVGYIRPLVGKLRAKVKKVHVFEHNPQLRGEALLDTFVDSILPKSNVVVISGSSLANGTVDRLLELSKGARVVVFAGPTSSTLPEPLFSRGVKIIAGVRAKGPKVVEAVAEAKPFVVFKDLVEKYVMKSTDNRIKAKK